ncbi:(2Fe-2S)-binding protein [Terrabacter carboxydivorans]|uniref:Ferric siderophore reductase C-terminal domain-containing protein n=1 Tax=Terrabacter carboxydivorans TaxID=619730 RepID=A0ABN3MJ78_9MICO
MEPEARAAGRAEVGRRDVVDVVAVVDRALPFTTLTCEPSAATVWWRDVQQHVRAGADPLEPWRSALRTQMGQRHESLVPAHVPAAFVLQWACEVAATPIAYAATLGPWLLVPSPAGLGLELAPGLNPFRIVVDPASTSLQVDEDPARRLRRAHAAYLELVSEVVTAYAPDVRMGSRQRWGVVGDMWRTALRLASGAAGESVGPEPARESCCFIYALPGMRECAACPRGGR